MDYILKMCLKALSASVIYYCFHIIYCPFNQRQGSKSLFYYHAMKNTQKTAKVHFQDTTSHPTSTLPNSPVASDCEKKKMFTRKPAPSIIESPSQKMYKNQASHILNANSSRFLRAAKMQAQTATKLIQKQISRISSRQRPKDTLTSSKSQKNVTPTPNSNHKAITPINNTKTTYITARHNRCSTQQSIPLADQQDLLPISSRISQKCIQQTPNNKSNKKTALSFLMQRCSSQTDLVQSVRQRARLSRMDSSIRVNDSIRMDSSICSIGKKDGSVCGSMKQSSIRLDSSVVFCQYCANNKEMVQIITQKLTKTEKMVANKDKEIQQLNITIENMRRQKQNQDDRLQQILQVLNQRQLQFNSQRQQFNLRMDSIKKQMHKLKQKLKYQSIQNSMLLRVRQQHQILAIQCDQLKHENHQFKKIIVEFNRTKPKVTPQSPKVYSPYAKVKERERGVSVVHFSREDDCVSLNFSEQSMDVRQ